MMRETKLSLKLKEIFETSSRPLSVAVILRILAKFGFKPNKTTIYRQLERLTNEGIVEHVHFEGRALGYELAKEHHHHLICNNCDKIEDLEIKNEDKLLSGLLNRKGFKPQSHHLEIFGLCTNCAK